MDFGEELWIAFHDNNPQYLLRKAKEMVLELEIRELEAEIERVESQVLLLKNKKEILKEKIKSLHKEEAFKGDKNSS